MLAALLPSAEAMAQGVSEAVTGEAHAVKPVVQRATKDWRQTLEDSGKDSNTTPQRRSISAEERGHLRRHVSDAARGAYQDDKVSGRGKR